MQFLETQDPKVSHQYELEKLFDKNQTMKRLRLEFSTPEMLELMESNEVDKNFGLDLLAQMCLRKQVTPGVLVGILRHHFEDQPNPSQACADEIYRVAGFDMLDWWQSERKFVACYLMPDDVQAEMDLFQYPLPLVVAPLELKSNSDTGYHINRKGSVISKRGAPDDSVDLCLDHLNRLNSIAFSINHRVAETMSNEWTNWDKRKPGEGMREFKERKQRFLDYDERSRDVLRSTIHFDEEMYLTHKYDFRGRTYCCGYHVNYQGTDWNKAVIQLSAKHQEIIPL